MKTVALLASCIALASSMPITSASQGSNQFMNPLAKVEARSETLPPALLRVWYHPSDPSGLDVEDIPIHVGADANGPSSGRKLTKASIKSVEDHSVEDKVACEAWKNFSSTSAGTFTLNSAAAFDDNAKGFTLITNIVCSVVQ
ncbi:hypothetical protein BDV96DRAFT_603917 [Lophiotrema nucula]|uniref:Uncharacterized protein n=1 Tax=Lophiotrema nucula TaxID=690887 RepID=A0A6A5YT51_9PLEO|nr:hypothetical protein BDV96DRAFT_603917 [Lophiotrema nucula]